MATDPITGKLVMFGGSEGTGRFLNDTWTWNGSGWASPNPANRPPPRSFAAMATDPATGTIVLFGGRSNHGINAHTFVEEIVRLNDTWTWSGTTKTWTQHFPVVSPPPGSEHSMAYDASTSTVVLLSGDKTWTWSGATKTWTRETPAVSPPPRDSTNMAYDPVTQQVVLFGGDDPCHATEGCVFYGDTWLWNGVAKTWAEVKPSTRPPGRAGGHMAYHPPTAEIVLFGGSHFGGSLNDTWLWNGANSTWTKATPSVKPCARSSGAMAYHPGTSLATLFGGGSGAVCSSEFTATWAWNGVNWKRKA